MTIWSRREFLAGAVGLAALGELTVNGPENGPANGPANAPASRFGMFGKITAQPGQRDALVAHLLEAAALVGNAPGCELYVVHTSPTEPDAIWVAEAWRSQADHAASLDAPGVRELIARARPLIAGMSDRVVTVPVGGKGLPPGQASAAGRRRGAPPTPTMPSDPGPPTPQHGRAFHRVVYPVPDRPRIVLADGTTGRVIDCSEHGLRYRPDRRPDARHPLPAFGVVLEARIEFLAAPDATVAGRVIRVDDGTVALYVASPPIPLNALFAEQRALRVRYPFGTGEGQPPAGG